MTTPGIITGSDRNAIFRQTTASSEPRSNQGVFGRNPGSTAKWANNRTRGIDAENREGMARLFVEIPANNMEHFLSTVSAETRPLARVLAVASDATTTGGTGFIDFLLTQTQENFQEKAQIVDTLTDNYVAFYSGQAPPVFNYSGTLLNTYQDDQRVWMLRLYREILRGTRLANRNLIARLRYDSFIVSGYLETLQLGIRGATEHTASDFSFSLRVKRLNIFTVGLGAPTIVQTAATTNSILTGEAEQRDAAARIGTLTTEAPASPSSQPGATASGLTDVQRATARLVLMRSGLMGPQADAALAAADALAASAEADERALASLPRSEGRERVSEHVEGSDINESNPDNATEDGTGGGTNVFQPGIFSPESQAALEQGVVPAPPPAPVVPFVFDTLTDQSYQNQVRLRQRLTSGGDADTPVYPLRTRETQRRRGGSSGTAPAYTHTSPLLPPIFEP